MKMHTNNFVDPTRLKTPTFINSFKSGCEFGRNAPKELLRYLSLRIVKFCTNSITQDEIILLNYKRSYLLKLSDRFNVYERGVEFPDIGKYLKKFLNFFEKLGDKSVLDFNEIEMINTYFPDFDSAFDAFFTELSLKNSINIDDDEPNDLCLLHELLVHTHFNRVNAEAYALSLRDQLIDIGYIAAICSNLTFHGNEKQMTKYITQIADELNLIAIHTFNYICNSLANAWPDVYHQIIKEKFKSLEITSSSARVLAMIIDSALKIIGETGEKNFQYQILIAKMGVQEQYYVGLPNYCSHKTGVYGHNVIINRINVNLSDFASIELQDGKMLKLRNFALKLNSTLKTEMDEIYNKETSYIVKQVKKKLPIFISDRLFKCWTMLRLYGDHWWSSCGNLTYAKRSYGYAELSGIASLRYETKGGAFGLCEKFLFNFFM
uniref:Uncharacterized protein n=1 Tax=Meloidogyne enterolobii TaxID=390850 RepID=A0A6V7VTU1_MELEN|nr:unnamed protein product [Meloidogyne enterolobii]